MTLGQFLLMFAAILFGGLFGFCVGQEEQISREAAKKAELARTLLEMSEECMRLQEQGEEPLHNEDWMSGAIWALVELR